MSARMPRQRIFLDELTPVKDWVKGHLGTILLASASAITAYNADNIADHLTDTFMGKHEAVVLSISGRDHIRHIR